MAISDRSNAPGYQKNEADMRAVCELAEALRDAVVEYKVRINFEAPGRLVEFYANDG